MALVGQPGQSAGAGQHAEHRHFGQADCRGAVVDQDDLVARQRQFVAAAGASAVDRRQEFESAVRRCIFHPVTRLVGELAEIHFPGVAAQTQHEDVGARAEDPFLGAGDHDGAHHRMLKADAADGVVEFNVNAEVVAVELEFVARPQATILVKVGPQRRNRAIEFQRPVAVARGMALVFDRAGMTHFGGPFSSVAVAMRSGNLANPENA